MLKTKWVENALVPCWEYKQGAYTLRVFKPEDSSVWHYSAFEGTTQRVIVEPVSPYLGTAKREATKWLRQQVAPQDEQAQAVNLATRLEQLEAMEKRLLFELEYAQMQANFATVDMLKSILQGEVAPNE